MPTYYRIRNRHSGKVLTAQIPEVGTQIVQWDPTLIWSQIFEIRDSQIYLKDYNLILAADQTGISNGRKLILDDPGSLERHKVSKSTIEGTKYVKFKIEGGIFSVEESRTDNQAKLVLWSDFGTHWNQHWELVEAHDHNMHPDEVDDNALE